MGMQNIALHCPPAIIFEAEGATQSVRPTSVLKHRYRIAKSLIYLGGGCGFTTPLRPAA
jgi:hypothetical protein